MMPGIRFRVLVVCRVGIVLVDCSRKKKGEENRWDG